MINDIINNSLYWEIILALILFYYIALRIAQRKQQKREGWNNFEFWIYFNLVDYYKFNWYPYPEINAKNTLRIVINMKDEECGLKPWIVVIDEAGNYFKDKKWNTN